MGHYKFKAGFLFGGLGAGARGFLDAASRLGPDTATFESVGGVDNDPLACKDFEMLTGSKCVCADLSKMQPAELRAAWGDERPDCIFLSPPCKGFSGLLSTANSKQPKYVALNELVLQGLFLALETWASPPPMIVIENVPRIASRGKPLLDRVKQLLTAYRYQFDERVHDCAAIGGLGAHRKRYLLVARRPDDTPGYVYHAPRRRIRACGEVLEALPMPESPEAGELHELPRISWLNMVRLACIPAGGDWRDLPAGPVAIEGDPTREGSFKGRPDAYGVLRWDKPAKTIRGKTVLAHSAAAVADPRLTSPVKDGEERRAHFMRYHVAGWDETARTVAGSGTNGNYGVADPRVQIPLTHKPRRGSYGVTGWDAPACTVRGRADVRQASTAVADPRIGLPAKNPGRHHNKYRIARWDRPAGTVMGATRPGSGGMAIADPRLKCKPRRGVYGVISWQAAAQTITGNARVDNGSFSVADPRKPPDGDYPIIIAEDGTWHRPLSTLELAALQGIPVTVDGQPLALAGRSVARWRERIGNAVPVQAAAAIAATILTTLLAGELGVWFVGTGGVWVRGTDGATMDEVNARFNDLDGGGRHEAQQAA